MRTVLNWKDYNIEIVGEVKNGEAALQFINDYEVHIALVDISMPVMDGITFSKLAMKINQDLKVLLITGHSEFEYAKKALQLGIYDYILKPFDEKELAESIEKVVYHLELIRQNQTREARRDVAVDEVGANALISDDLPTMQKEIEELLIKCAKGHQIWGYRLLVVEEDFFSQQWITGGQKYLWRKTVINILNELLQDKLLHLSFCGRSGNVVVILLFEDQKSAESYTAQEFHRLCRMIHNKLGFSITCAFSETVQDYEQIPALYDRAVQLLGRKFQLGYGSVLEEKDRKRDTVMKHYPRIPAESLIASLKNGNMEESMHIIQTIFEEMDSRERNMEMTGVVFMELISICLSYLTERGFEITKVLGNGFIPFSQMKQLLTIESAKEQVSEIYKKAIGAYTENQFTKSNKIAVQAVEHIKEYYVDRHLSVESVARALYINTSYLRTVFKKECGLTVSGYIFRLRMEKARDLIEAGNLRLADISQMVGFSDAAYFSKCFKKHYGISPSAFGNIREVQ